MSVCSDAPRAFEAATPASNVLLASRECPCTTTKALVIKRLFLLSWESTDE